MLRPRTPVRAPRPAASRSRPVPARAAWRKARAPPPPPPPPPAATAALSAGGLLLWGGLLTYALAFSPNGTPFRDEYFVRKLVGLGEADGVAINTVFTSLFNAMGVWPAVYAALLIPAARSRTGLPAWPFVSASFFLGFFALGPYLALWTPDPAAVAPPTRDELGKGGIGSLCVRALESRWTAGGLAAVAALQLGLAASAGPAAWVDYGRLFDESRFVHVTTLDFLTLSALAPFWVANDAGRRGATPAWLPALGFLPLLGPALYLVLRPRAGDGGE